MAKSSRLAASAVLLCGVALAFAAFAGDVPSGGGGDPHGGSMGGGGGPHGGPMGGGPMGGPHGGMMPPPGFHNAPPSFQGTLPHGGFMHPGFIGRLGVGSPGHDLGTFHGHVFNQFTPAERTAWEHGEWHHAWHNGHYGWWWFAAGLWFFYPEPIYPFPLYVGPDYWYDYDGEFGMPPYYWYYCENPPGYYPYVQQCNGPWQPVPPTPWL